MNEPNQEPTLQKSLSSSVNMSLANLVGLASQQAEPIRTQIAEIRSDIARLDKGSFAVPALKQAMQLLEVAENSTMDKAKESLGLLIAQWCKEQGIVLAPVQIDSKKHARRRLSPEEKAQAAKTIWDGTGASSGLSRGDAAKIADITREQAATILKKLVVDGKLTTQGVGKNTRYLKKEPLRNQTQQQIMSADGRTN